MYPYKDKRFFWPKRVDDLIARAFPFVGKWVTVQSWHENISMKDRYPLDKTVGFVEDFTGDIPESELLIGVPMDIDDLIYQFVEDLDFDALKHWCAILGVDYEEPPLDDMYPDWEGELRGEIAEAMGKVGQKWQRNARLQNVRSARPEYLGLLRKMSRNVQGAEPNLRIIKTNGLERDCLAVAWQIIEIGLILALARLVCG